MTFSIVCIKETGLRASHFDVRGDSKARHNLLKASERQGSSLATRDVTRMCKKGRLSVELRREGCFENFRGGSCNAVQNLTQMILAADKGWICKAEKIQMRFEGEFFHRRSVEKESILLKGGRVASPLISRSALRLCTNVLEREMESVYLRKEIGVAGLGQAMEGREAVSTPRESGCSGSGDKFLLSFSTFNILAPIYKRTSRKGDENIRESMVREDWLLRNQAIIRKIMEQKSSVICLQEVWLQNREIVQMYEDALGAEGYSIFTLARTNNRGDGLLTAVDEARLQVVDSANLLFNDCGDRVALLLRIRACCQDLNLWPYDLRGKGVDGSTSPTGNPNSKWMEFLVVNTHLLFPHDANSTYIRLNQISKVLESLEEYKARHGLSAIPIIICGDLNGGKDGRVYQLLRSQGFISSFDEARHFPDDDIRWVSHRNHRGEACGVDYIWLLNPSHQTSPLTADWKSAVFRLIQEKLKAAGLGGERAAFDYFRSLSDGEDSESEMEQESFTLADFELGMDQLGLTGEDSVGLTRAEIKQLLESADVDGNGLIDYPEFHGMVRRMMRALEQSKKERMEDGNQTSAMNKGLNLRVKDASLFPREMEDGVWPADYSLSDHAMLTVAFEVATDDK